MKRRIRMAKMVEMNRKHVLVLCCVLHCVKALEGSAEEVQEAWRKSLPGENDGGCGLESGKSNSSKKKEEWVRSFGKI
jgi:hypothetical protein